MRPQLDRPGQPGGPGRRSGTPSNSGVALEHHVVAPRDHVADDSTSRRPPASTWRRRPPRRCAPSRAPTRAARAAAGRGPARPAGYGASVTRAGGGAHRARSRARRRAPGRTSRASTRVPCRRRSPRRAAPHAAAVARRTSTARRCCRSDARSPAPRWRRGPPAARTCRRGRHRSSHRSSRPSTVARDRASATSWEPSSCTPARPSATAGTARGLPDSSTAYGDMDEAVPPAPTSSSTDASPGRATRVTLGAALSAASSASSSPSSPRARCSSSTTHRGGSAARRRSRPSATVGATRRTQPSRSWAHLVEHRVDEPGGTAADAAPDQVHGRADRGVRGHPHGEQLVRAQAQRVEHVGVDLASGRSTFAAITAS